MPPMHITITVDFDNDEVRMQDGSSRPIACKVKHLGQGQTYDMLVELLHMLDVAGTVLMVQDEGESKTVAEW